MVKNGIAAALLMIAAAIGNGPAWAQSSVPTSVRAANTSRTAEAADTARQAAQVAARVSKGQADKSKDFLAEQSQRAARIRDANLANADKAFYEQADAVKRQQEGNGAWAREQMARAQAIGNASIDEAARAQEKADGPKRPKYIVFVSQSMGLNTLKTVFAYGRGRTDMFFAFRGFLPKQDPKQFVDLMRTLQAGRDPSQMTSVSLDTPAFKKYDITRVPAIVKLDEDENLIAKVTGLVNYQWLKEQVDEGRKGDLGIKGAVFPITEVDLIEQMKAKAAAYDYKSAAEGARKRFFEGLKTLDLPYATQQRVRKVFPLMTVNDDVVDSEGNVRYRKGERIDMTDQLKRAPMLIVFNSQDPYHVEFAKSMAKRAPKGRKVILLTTRVDRDGGIPKYASQEFAIGRPVYLLMDDVKNTFGIERVPTVVTPNEKEFVVVEVPLTQGVSGNARAHAP